MHDEIDFDAILNKYRADPYGYVHTQTNHTGQVRFNVREQDTVSGPGGQWNHIPGTLLYKLYRERNPKPIYSSINGVISFLRSDLEGKFVEAGEKVLTIRHPLKKKDIIESILRRVLLPFKAPERAKYFFALDIQNRIEKYGQRAVTIKHGDEILTMSLMKRDTPVYYSGETGVIHSVYFKPGINSDQGETLIGVCPHEKFSLIRKIIDRVKDEWE